MTGHVLVARLDNNGDVLLAGPAIRAVAANADRVTLLCGPRGLAAAELLPGVDHIEVVLAPWIDPEPPPLDRATVDELVWRIQDLACDKAVIFTSFHQSSLPLAMVLRMAGVPFIAGISEDYPGSLLDVRLSLDARLHEVEQALSVAAAAGFWLPADDDRRLRIRRMPVAAAEAVRPTPRPYVVVHPGSSVPARAWSPDRAQRLVAELAVGGHQVVVTGAPDERALTAEVASGDPGAIDLGGLLDFGELAEVIAQAEAVVVGNTGPAHLAAAVGTPVVSLFAPTVPARQWRPWMVPTVMLGHQDIGCAGCRARECPVEGHPCLAIPPSEVAAAVGRLVGRDAQASATEVAR